MITPYSRAALHSGKVLSYAKGRIKKKVQKHRFCPIALLSVIPHGSSCPGKIGSFMLLIAKIMRCVPPPTNLT